jgi:YD repeat-containing protein
MGIDSLATFGREGVIRWDLHVRGKIHKWGWFEWGRLRNRQRYNRRSKTTSCGVGKSIRGSTYDDHGAIFQGFPSHR